MQINKQDEKLMDFLSKTAENCGFILLHDWRDFGCNEHYPSKENTVFWFYDSGSLPEVQTPRGKYYFGSYGCGCGNSFIEYLKEKYPNYETNEYAFSKSIIVKNNQRA